MKIFSFLFCFFMGGAYVNAQRADSLLYPDESLKATGLIVGGEKEGEWLYYYPNGTLSAKEHYQEGYLQGGAAYYGFDGQLHAIENYQNGITEDSAWYFYPNGQLHRKGVFKNGLYEGEWYTFSEEGIITRKGAYRRVYRKESGCFIIKPDSYSSMATLFLEKKQGNGNIMMKMDSWNIVETGKRGSEKGFGTNSVKEEKGN